VETDLHEEWVSKAEQDVRAAFRLLRTCPAEVSDVICWLCLQCTEKYLKAFMTSEPNLGFIRGHDLVVLNRECIKEDAEFCELGDDLDKLYELGQPSVRYPGLVTDSADGKEAFRIAMRVRRLVRRKLWNEDASLVL
jgi:HEPN domain-containing protein